VTQTKQPPANPERFTSVLLSFLAKLLKRLIELALAGEMIERLDRRNDLGR